MSFYFSILLTKLALGMGIFSETPHIDCSIEASNATNYDVPCKDLSIGSDIAFKILLIIIETVIKYKKINISLLYKI